MSIGQYTLLTHNSKKNLKISNGGLEPPNLLFWYASETGYEHVYSPKTAEKTGQTHAYRYRLYTLEKHV